MPSDTTPEQALSRTPDRRRGSKIGGCVGVLFQIFHGTRLFPRKSLPAEKPKQDSLIHPEDKLPVVKLLPIADADNFGVPKDIPEGFQGGKDELCEGRPPCRSTPSVVARLMGLETMPPSEPVDDGKCLDTNKDAYGASANVLQERDVLSKSGKSIACGRQHVPLSVDRIKGSRRGLAEKFVTRRKLPSCTKAEVKGEVVKKKVLSNRTSLSPHHLDSDHPTIISASEENPINMRAKTRRTVLTHVKERVCIDAKDKNLTDEANWSPKDKRRTQQTNKAMVAPSVSTSITPSPNRRGHHQVGFVGSKQLHDGANSTLREPSPSKRKESYQQGVMQPRAHVSKKAIVDRCQQVERSRRLSQPAATSNSIKTQGSRVSGSVPVRRMNPYSKIVPSSSEASNGMCSSGPGSGSSQQISSHTSRNGVTFRPTKRLPTLLAKGVPSRVKEGCDGAEAMPSGVSLCDNRPVLSQEDPSIFQEPSIHDLMHLCSRSEGDTSSSSSTIYTEIFQRSSMESSLSSDQSLSDINSSLGDGSSFLRSADVIGGERVLESWETGATHLSADCERASRINVQSTEECLPSNLDSINGDLADTASSSFSCPESDGQQQTLSYSSKNTAAILQELLMALKFSKSDQTSGDQQNTMPSLERLCQDSPFYNSTHNSGTSQGKEAFEANKYLHCVHCTSISKTQVEHEGATITSSSGSMPSYFLERIEVQDCEALMNTISKLHHIDPKVIGLNVRAAMYHEEKMLKGNGGEMSNQLTNSREEEHHLKVGLPSYYGSLSVADDAESLYRSEMESGLKDLCEDVAVQNKKLLLGCINEALKSLSKGSFKCSSNLWPSSAASHVLHRVYAQIDEWKGMSISMNLNHMVEREMENVARRWPDIIVEKEEVMKVVESTIFGGLVEEILLELI